MVLILETFDNTVVTALAALHHGIPFFGLGVHGTVRDVVVAVLADGEVEGGLGAVIGVGKGFTHGFVVGVRVYERKVEGEEEVDAVFLGLFPLQNVGVRSGVVGRIDTGEYEAVVAVGKVGQDLAEHDVDAIAELEVFTLDVEGKVWDEVGVVGVEVAVGFVDLVDEVGDPFVEGLGHPVCAGVEEAVKNQVFELEGVVSLSVEDEFTVDEGTRVEKGGIFRGREMKVWDAVIVVFAVDKVRCLCAIGVGGQVHQATYAVRFLADIIVLGLELGQMAGRKADRLCAWKAKIVSTT